MHHRIVPLAVVSGPSRQTRAVGIARLRKVRPIGRIRSDSALSSGSPRQVLRSQRAEYEFDLRRMVGAVRRCRIGAGSRARVARRRTRSGRAACRRGPLHLEPLPGRKAMNWSPARSCARPFGLFVVFRRVEFQEFVGLVAKSACAHRPRNSPPWGRLFQIYCRSRLRRGSTRPAAGRGSVCRSQKYRAHCEAGNIHRYSPRTRFLSASSAAV